MKNLNAGACPVLNVGDRVTSEGNGYNYNHEAKHPERRLKHSQVVALEYNEYTQGCCEAWRCLFLLKLENGEYVNPGNTTIDCSKCPILEEHPKHFETTPTRDDLQAVVNVYKNDGLLHWMNTEIVALKKQVGILDAELARMRDNKESIDPDMQDGRNIMAGRNNALHAAKHFMTKLDRDDFVEELEKYKAYRAADGNEFGNAIANGCREVQQKLKGVM